MKLLKISAIRSSKEEHAFGLSKGFTLIEILVVVGIIGVILTLSILFGFDSIVRGNVHSERDLVAASLTNTRAKSLANINEAAHGVRITDTQIIFFDVDGGTCNEISGSANPIERSSSITVDPEPAEVIFDQLSARVTCTIPGTITLSGGGQSAEIDVNTEGRIDW